MALLQARHEATHPNVLLSGAEVGSYVPSKQVSKNRTTTTTNIQKESPSNLKLSRERYSFGGNYTLHEH